MSTLGACEAPHTSLHTSGGVPGGGGKPLISCRDCGSRWTSIGWEHCTVCHATFTSTQAGDRHRIGPHDGERHCLTTSEIVSLTKKDGTSVYEYAVKAGTLVWSIRRQ